MLHLGVHAFAASFNTDDVYFFVVEEGVEEAHGVGAAADGSDERIGQTAFGLLHLGADFLADDALEIADHGGVRVWACHCADAIEGIAHVCDPVAQGIVHGVLERATA